MYVNFGKNITLLLLIIVTASCTVPKADIILTNGKIFTSDTTQLYVAALAIRGNKIIAAGSNETALRYATSTTKIIDLKGKTVIPGLNDAHDHLGWLSPVGISFSYPQNDPAGLSKNAVLDSLSRLVKFAKKNQWISGWIGTRILFDTSMRASLDSIAPDNPVILQAWWGHGQVVNGKALAVSGLSDNDKDPMGGRYIRVPSTGFINTIHENAQVPVWNEWLGTDAENQLKGLRAYSEKQLRVGITTVQQMSSTFNAQQSLHLFKTANLSQRIRVIAWPRSNATGRQLAAWNIKNDSDNNHLYFSGIKYMIDGTPLEQNAFNKKPYNPQGDWYGMLNYPVDTIQQILKDALQSNQQLMLHITGDSSMAIVLSQMKLLASATIWRSKRVRIEHNSIMYTQQELNDVAALGLIVMHTPVYNQQSSLQSLIKKGIITGIAPDGTTNPFWEIMVITSQQVKQEENISREQAVIAYTNTNAFAEFMEKEKGELKIGMLADLAVLSQDIFTIATEQLPATTSVLTMVDGKIVYQKPE